MTRKNGFAIAAAGVAVCAAVWTFSSQSETRVEPTPPSFGMKDGRPDPIVRIEINEYRHDKKPPAFVESATIGDVTRLAQVDTFFRNSASAWKRLDGELAAIPRAKFTFIRWSGTKDELTLIDSAFVNADWILRFDCDAYLMFNNLIQPAIRIPSPPQSNPSPLTWLLKIVSR